MTFARLRSLAVFAVVAIAAIPAFAGSGALSLVPTDAVTVGVVKFNELRSSPLSSTLFQQTDKFGSNGDAAEFIRETGLDPTKDIDVLVVATSPRTTLGSEAEVLVVAEGRFNTARLTKALTERGAVKKTVANGTYFTMPDSNENDHPGAVSFPTGNLAIIGSESAVVEALSARASGGTGFTDASGLGRDTARIDANASAWAVVDVTRAQRLTNSPRVPGKNNQGEALAAALKSVSTIAVWATDTGDSLKLAGFGLASDAETLELVEDTLRGALSAMRLAVKDKSPEMVSVLRKFDVDRTSDSVRISGTIPAETLRQLVSKAKQHHAAK